MGSLEWVQRSKRTLHFLSIAFARTGLTDGWVSVSGFPLRGFPRLTNDRSQDGTPGKNKLSLSLIGYSQFLFAHTAFRVRITTACLMSNTEQEDSQDFHPGLGNERERERGEGDSILWAVQLWRESAECRFDLLMRWLCRAL